MMLEFKPYSRFKLNLLQKNRMTATVADLCSVLYKLPGISPPFSYDVLMLLGKQGDLGSYLLEGKMSIKRQSVAQLVWLRG